MSHSQKKQINPIRVGTARGLQEFEAIRISRQSA